LFGYDKKKMYVASGGEERLRFAGSPVNWRLFSPIHGCVGGSLFLPSGRAYLSFPPFVPYKGLSNSPFFFMSILKHIPYT